MPWHPLQRRHNGHGSVSNHAQINEIIKALRHCFCEGNSLGTGEFPSQRASNAENVSIWWRHNVTMSQSGKSQIITKLAADNRSGWAQNGDTFIENYIAHSPTGPESSQKWKLWTPHGKHSSFVNYVYYITLATFKCPQTKAEIQGFNKNDWI